MENWDEIKGLLDKEVERRVNARFDRVKTLLGNGHAKPKRKGSTSVHAGRSTGNTAKKLQGRYMGLTRNLSVANKAKVKKTREEKGYRAAIAEAKRLSA